MFEPPPVIVGSTASSWKSASTGLIVNQSSPSTQGVEELKSIHTLPSLLLYEKGVLVHIVEGIVSEV